MTSAAMESTMTRCRPLCPEAAEACGAGATAAHHIHRPHMVWPRQLAWAAQAPLQPQLLLCEGTGQSLCQCPARCGAKASAAARACRRHAAQHAASCSAAGKARKEPKVCHVGHEAACLACIGLQHSLKMVDVVDLTDCHVPERGSNAAWGPRHAALHLQPASIAVVVSAGGLQCGVWMPCVCVGPEETG